MTEYLNYALDNLNYGWVYFLMLLESTVIPVPSEFVVTPAAFNAAEGALNIWLVILFATIGADCGATINYVAGYYLGRPIIYAFANSKLGRVLQLSSEKIERAEAYFNDHGVASTLVGRFIPVIRQLISIPAGLAKMNIGAFVLYTTLGAAAWNFILALLGYLAHLAGDISVVERYSNEISYAIIGLVLLVVLFFVIRHFVKKRKHE